MPEKTIELAPLMGFRREQGEAISVSGTAAFYHPLIASHI